MGIDFPWAMLLSQGCFFMCIVCIDYAKDVLHKLVKTYPASGENLEREVIA